MSQVIFNFALLPDAAFSKELVDLARAMREIPGLEYTLGADSLPHVTVLQFRGDLSEAADVWSALGPVNQAALEVHFRGLAFERWRAWDGIWLRMKHHAGVRALQAGARALLPGRTFENGLDDIFEPHATLAAWPKRDRSPEFPLVDHMLDRPGIRVTAALGVSGPQFQFARRLF